MIDKLASCLTGFLFFLVTPVSLCAQKTNADSSQLVRIEQQLLNDIGPGITTNWNKYLHSDCVIVTEDGTVLDKKTFIDEMQPMPRGLSGHINVINPKTVANGNTVVITYVADEYESVFENKLHTTYSVMNTYIKHDTSWQLISMHIFEIPQLPAVIHLSSDILKKYTGTYQMADNFCTVFLRNDSLFYQKKNKPEVLLLAETENVFFRMGDARGRKLFVPDENATMLLRERRNGQDLIWKRVKN